MTRRRAILLALAAVAALSCAAPADAGGPKKSVGVADNYYLPAKLTMKKGTTIVWKWPDEAVDVHDVKLKSGPKGVKKFQSEAAASDYTFKRTLRKVGKYRIVCTLHEEMRLTIRVRR